MLTDKEKNKIRSLDPRRRIEILYGLLRSNEKELAAFDSREFSKAQFLLESLKEEKGLGFERFQKILRQIPEPRDLQVFLSFLERHQGLNLKDEDLVFHVKEGDAKKPLAPKVPLYFVLHNLRSSFNIGSIFRAAECAGVAKIFLSGYTASPDNHKIKKAAMGAEKLVEWEYIPEFEKLLEKLKKDSIESVALETVENSPSVYDEKISKSTAIWVGNEVFGLEKEVLSAISSFVHIPLYGTKNSLNVAQALTTTALLWGENLRAKDIYL
ncbi:MAG: TrmH family RNA methyltransferase [Bdellovibrionota bacterium]|nr:TrmH family RNA methyltransferase [Bdellovibrionota bacterium]